MTPLVTAYVVVGPLAFVVGFTLRALLTPAAKSSPRLDPQTIKDIAMAVIAELEQPIADLNAAVASLPDKIAGLGVVTAQDKADTISAVQGAMQGAVNAINGIGT